MACRQNWCISFVVFTSGRCRFPRNSPISFHLPLYSSASLNPTNGSYALPLHFRSGPRSTRICHKLASIVSSRSSSSSGSGSPSPCGCHERPSGPPFSLPGTCFKPKSNSRIHTIQRSSSASGRSLVGKYSCCTNALVSVSTRNLTPYT